MPDAPPAEDLREEPDLLENCNQSVNQLDTSINQTINHLEPWIHWNPQRSKGLAASQGDGWVCLLSAQSTRTVPKTFCGEMAFAEQGRHPAAGKCDGTRCL